MLQRKAYITTTKSYHYARGTLVCSTALFVTALVLAFLPGLSSSIEKEKIETNTPSPSSLFDWTRYESFTTRYQSDEILVVSNSLGLVENR